ncbi:MAG: carbon storage regulator [Planctomycetota bacterium]
MLVLTRKTGERILIGKDVVIEVMEAKDGRVRLGIEAPRDVPIVRAEIADRPQAGREAGSPRPAFLLPVEKPGGGMLSIPCTTIATMRDVADLFAAAGYTIHAPIKYIE